MQRLSAATANPHRRAALRVGVGLIAASASRGSWAQAATDDKPIRLVVPFPASDDTTTRVLAQALSQELNTTVVVENIPGATGTLGTTQVARSAPDGRTIMMGVSATHAIAPALFKTLRYKPEQDFTAIARIARGGTVLVASLDFPANTVSEMIALAKRTQEPLLYGTWGHGSGGHLAVESLCLSAGITMRHVPYKGPSQTLQDLMGGHLQIGMADVVRAVPLVNAGRIKALGVTGSTRFESLPQVPTFSESGIPFDTDSWMALFAPARVPPATLQRLVNALASLPPRSRARISSASGIRTSALGPGWSRPLA